MTNRTAGARYPQTNYKTSNYCIAYLDILGAKNLMFNDEDSKFLNRLNMFFEDAKMKAKFAESMFKDEIFVKIFSDNILLAIELNNSNDKEKLEKISTLFNLVANIYNEIFRYGYLIRGAIVEGEFFHNDIIVYGKGLVNAYKNEEEIAIYPRIIVQESTSKYIPLGVIKDFDGMFILNPFLFAECFDYLSFKNTLLKQLKESKDDDKVKQKIMWTINYYNDFYQTHLSGISEKPKITKEDIESTLNYNSTDSNISGVY